MLNYFGVCISVYLFLCYFVVFECVFASLFACWVFVPKFKVVLVCCCFASILFVPCVGLFGVLIMHSVICYMCCILC